MTRAQRAEVVKMLCRKRFCSSKPLVDYQVENGLPVAITSYGHDAVIPHPPELRKEPEPPPKSEVRNKVPEESPRLTGPGWVPKHNQCTAVDQSVWFGKLHAIK